MGLVEKCRFRVIVVILVIVECLFFLATLVDSFSVVDTFASCSSPASRNLCGINRTITVNITLKDVEGPTVSVRSCFVNDVNVSSRTVYDSGQHTLSVMYTVKEDDPDRETGHLPIVCDLLDSGSNLTVSFLSKSISVYSKLPVIQSLVASSTKEIIGIGSVLPISVTTLPTRSVQGSCIINGEKEFVDNSIVSYTLKEGDPNLPMNSLPYDCQIRDDAGNEWSGKGIVASSPAIDATRPSLYKTDMIFSSDNPAKIGSVISITLKSKHLNETGYKGSCTVNNQSDIYFRGEQDEGIYVVPYQVALGDPDVTNGKLKVACEVKDPADNSFHFEDIFDIPFNIDATPPVIDSVSILFVSDNPAHEDSIVEVRIQANEHEKHLYVGSCSVNNVHVNHTFSQAGTGSYLLTYVVGEGEAHWAPGQLSISCDMYDLAGNVFTVDKFTDNNKIEGRQIKPQKFTPAVAAYIPDKLLAVGFFIVAVASHTISRVFPRIGLPVITGFLVTGLLAGPYVLVLIDANEMKRLRFIDDVALAYIGIAAGSKLHWHEMKPMIRSIAWVTLGLTLTEYFVGTLTIIILSKYLAFLRATSSQEKLLIALLAGCMMIARSPSSALAVIEEVKSQGRFTTMIFAVTVACDIVVIFIFNVNSMIAEALLSGETISGKKMLILFAQFTISIAAGVVSGKVFSYILFWKTSVKRKSKLFEVQTAIKMATLGSFGFFMFLIGHQLNPWMEPLLTCMVAGATISNWTRHFEEFAFLIRKLSPFIYCAFFTLTGASLELSMLAKAVLVSVLLSGTRIIAIFVGAYIGGTVAGESKEHNCVSWMAYITQAGVTLGLAKQIQLLYPGWGSLFSTFIVAVVVTNQLLGPPMLRFVLRHVGDVKSVEKGQVTGMRALVLGNTPNVSPTMFRMKVCGWDIVHAINIPMEEKIITDEKQEDIQSTTTTEDTAQEQDPSSTLPAKLEEFILALFANNETFDVVIVMSDSDDLNHALVRAIANVCTRISRLAVLRVVVQIVNNEPELGWAWRFADMPTVEVNGDAIDVTVVDGNGASDMVIELAAKGKLGSFGAEITSPRPKQMYAPVESQSPSHRLV